ncbi:MAG TPA: hypothetical protein VIJ93_11515, partial [bacterium]
SLLSWTLPVSLSPGNYQLSYQTRVNNFVKSGTVLTNNAQLTYQGLGAPVSTSVSTVVTGQYTIKIGVYNEAGEMVKEVLIEQLSQAINNINLQPAVITSLHGQIDIYYQGALIGTWDGTNNTGDPISNGIYHIKVDSVDSVGAVQSVTQDATVSRVFYKTTILVYNEAGEVVRHLYTYLDDPGKQAVLSMQLSTAFIVPGATQVGAIPNQVAITLSNGTIRYWDGKGDTGAYLENGQYFIEVHSKDGQGGETLVTQRVSLEDFNAASGVGTVIAQPNMIQPGGSTLVTFKTNSAMVLTLQVSLYTLAGELVMTIPGDSGTNQALWDTKGVASGLYLALVESRNASGGLAARQTLKVVVLH